MSESYRSCRRDGAVFSLWGAHAPSRAADGALAVGRFRCASRRTRLFWRGRQNQHAGARALPRPWAASFLISAILLSASISADGKAITLDAALATALEKNPEIMQARIALEQAAGRRLVFRSNALPDLKIQGVAGVQGGKRADEPTIRPFAFARGFFAQPLFDAAIPASRRRGDIEILLAQQRLNVAVVGQLHATRMAFYTALYNDSLRNLGEAQRQRLTQNASTQAERYQAGQSNRGALLGAQLLERELEPRIQEVQRGYDGALLTLATIMGTDPAEPAGAVRPEGELQFASANYDLQMETAAALSQRPDLQLARILVRAAAEDQRIIQAQYYPALDATISGTGIPVTVRTANGGSALSSDDILSSEGMAGVAFTWRVVDNGRVGGQVIQARAIREMNEISLRQLEANVALELKRISNNFGAIERRWKSLSGAIAGAERNVNVVQRTLAEGLSSQLEFRNAESSFLETKGALLTAAYQQNVARAEWDRATGRYFQFSKDTAGNLH
jgi:outer membrane protein TolC